ncbi:MAG: hypothetical protein MO847_10075, partial [Candidatus Protistobacter heckmanni]|nr:hypothetical protein [Candidatus Protistobacter heckmanni]
GSIVTAVIPRIVAGNAIGKLPLAEARTSRMRATDRFRAIAANHEVDDLISFAIRNDDARRIESRQAGWNADAQWQSASTMRVAGYR